MLEEMIRESPTLVVLARHQYELERELLAPQTKRAALRLRRTAPLGPTVELGARKLGRGRKNPPDSPWQRLFTVSWLVKSVSVSSSPTKSASRMRENCSETAHCKLAELFPAVVALQMIAMLVPSLRRIVVLGKTWMETLAVGWK